MRKRFIEIPARWLIRFLLKYCIPQWEIRTIVHVPKGYHLHKNPVGSGRRKKVDIKAGDKIRWIGEEVGHKSPLGDEISNEYRTSHLGKFPGKNMGD